MVCDRFLFLPFTVASNDDSFPLLVCSLLLEFDQLLGDRFCYLFVRETDCFVRSITGNYIFKITRGIDISKIALFSGGFSNSTIGLFSGMIATDRVPNIQLGTTNNGLSMDDSNVATEVDSKVKTKLLSMWNNVKYG